jgi:hypothetical protein
MKKLQHETLLKEIATLVARQANISVPHATEEVEIYLDAFHPSDEALADSSKLATQVVAFYLKSKLYMETKPKRI